MKNFKSEKFDVVFGENAVSSLVMANKQFMERSLVIVARGNGAEFGTWYNIAAKCRNTDKVSIVKSFVKAWLAAEREAYVLNTSKEAKNSKNTQKNELNKVTSGFSILVTDKLGNLLPDSELTVRERDSDKANLTEVLKPKKSHPIYKLVVEKGLDWSDKQVVEHMTDWCMAAVAKLDYAKNMDAAIGKAADHTDATDKASTSESASKSEPVKKSLKKAA